MNPKLNVSVRDIVQWAKTGDLHPAKEGREYRPPTAEEGAIAHSAVAKITAFNEYKVSRCIKRATAELTITGRIDSADVTPTKTELIEVKATRCSPEFIAESVVNSHRLQLMIYGYLWCLDHGNLPDLNLVHVDVRKENIHSEQLEISVEALCEQVETILDAYLDFAIQLHRYRCDRSESLKRLVFPKKDFRPGQRELCAAYWRAIRDHEHVLAEVPTGAGKTLSALFPAIKRLVEDTESQIIYVTAKGSGSELVVDALEQWQNLGVQALHFASREKSCGCNGADCEYQKGFFDRLRPALLEAVNYVKCWDIGAVQALAAKYKLCCYGLQKSLAKIADVVVTDFNSVIRPKAYFPTRERSSVLLIDEVHNLVNRARELYSATLSLDHTMKLRKAWRRALPSLARRLDKIIKLQRVAEAQEQLSEMNLLIKRLMQSFEQLREKPPGYVIPEDLLEPVFSLYRWIDAADTDASIMAPIIEPESITLFCWQPAPILSSVWSKFDSVIAFSGTLSPLDFHRDQLGLSTDTHCYLQPSPFNADQQSLELWTDIRGDYRSRDVAIKQLCQRISDTRDLKGRLLLAVPSYAVASACAEYLDNALLIGQSVGVDQLLSQWQQGQIVVAPMGGKLTEGVDFASGFLTEVVVFSLGMPAPDLYTKAVESGYSAQGYPGFQYAFVYPGMTKVLQAAGRLIRSSEHRGRLVLADHRWQQPQYLKLLPQWWNTV